MTTSREPAEEHARLNPIKRVNEADTSGRNPYLKDRDKIYYSDEFRRLEGVTQVAELEVPGLHNRLTHSLRVEQVARTLALRLREKYPYLEHEMHVDVVKAAALAHDLGHPPFGHAGEMALQGLVACDKHRETPDSYQNRIKYPCKDPKCSLQDSFEGNAQTMRMVAVTGVSEDFVSGNQPFGLDLQARTIRAVAKYPWVRGEQKASRKWGFYDCDAGILEWAFGGKVEDYGPDNSSKSLEAQIMDWADDIAYAVHDLEDFFRAGVIPLQQLKYLLDSYSFQEFSKYLSGQGDIVGERIASIYGQLEEYRIAAQADDGAKPADGNPFLERLTDRFEEFPGKRFTGTGLEVRQISILRTHLIEYFESSVSVKDGRLEFDEYCKDINETLKQLVWFYVIDSPMLAAVQAGQSDLIARLYTHYLAALEPAWGNGGFEPDSKAARTLPRRLVDFARISGKDAELGLGSYGQVGDGAIQSNRARAVVDFIASLTEDQAYSLGARLLGQTDGRRFAVGVV